MLVFVDIFVPEFLGLSQIGEETVIGPTFVINRRTPKIEVELITSNPAVYRQDRDELVRREQGMDNIGVVDGSMRLESILT